MNKQEKLFIYNRNIKILPYIFGLLSTPLYFFSTIFAYSVTDSFLMASMVIAFGELVKSFMEIPTGVVSDRFLGRKGTQLAADTFQIIGMIIQALGIYDWRLLFVGEFFIGVAIALYSGNANSLLHNTLSLIDKEGDYHKKYAKMNHYRYLFLSLSLLISGLLAYYFHVVFVIVFCIVQRFGSLFVGFCLKEPSIYHKNKNKTIKEGFFHIFNSAQMIYQMPKLRNLAFLSVFRKSFDALDMLAQVFYKTVLSFLSIGILLSGSLFVCNFTSLYSEKIASKYGFLKTFIGVRLISIPLQLLGFLFPGFYSPILIEMGASLNPIETSAQSALLHKEFTDKQRATMESIIEFFGSIGFALCATFLGWLAQVWTLSGALCFGVLLKLLIIPLCIKIFQK